MATITRTSSLYMIFKCCSAHVVQLPYTPHQLYTTNDETTREYMMRSMMPTVAVVPVSAPAELGQQPSFNSNL